MKEFWYDKKLRSYFNIPRPKAEHWREVGMTDLQSALIAEVKQLIIRIADANDEMSKLMIQDQLEEKINALANSIKE